MKFEALTKHRWVQGCVITESVATEKNGLGYYNKKYTAEIDGKGNFKIFEGIALQENDHFIPDLIAKVEAIQNKSFEKKTVFNNRRLK